MPTSSPDASLASLRHLRPGRVRAGRLDAAGFASACLDGGARFLQVRAKQASARRCSRRRTRSSRAPRREARSSSSTIARTSPGWPAPAASTSDRTICRPTRSARSSDRRGRRSLDAHGRSAGRGARPAGELRGDRTGLRHAHEGDRATRRSASPGDTSRRVRSRRPRRADCPLVAIGGITLGNARSVIDAGAAVGRRHLRSVGHGDPADRVAQFLRPPRASRTRPVSRSRRRMGRPHQGSRQARRVVRWSSRRTHAVAGRCIRTLEARS